MLHHHDPMLHCNTRYKVLLLNRLLNEPLVSDADSSLTEYIMWVDADAAVVEHELSVQSIAEAAGFRDLVVVGFS
jgi:hypothetical protein